MAGPSYAGFMPRPAWMRVSPFPSALVIPPRHGLEPLQLAALWLMVFTGAFPLVDILYSIASLAALGLFALLGLRLDRANLPLIFLLVVFNLGGLIALQPYLDVPESREFMVGTCFVAITAIFFCMSLNENALQRLEAMKWGLAAGGLVAALAGIIGYTNIGGLGAIFSMHEGRASGTFRDPNVLGSFLVVPAIFLASDVLRLQRYWLIKAVILAVVMMGLLLTLSRGSWIGLVIGLGLLAGLIFITANNAAIRSRILISGILGVVLLAFALAAILSIDSVAEGLADRFTLQKDYDSGPSGRFGNQLRALPELLSLPFGYGPNRFWFYFPENPHNTYIMAFASYGWLGGIAFLAFVISTVVVGFRACLQRTPFQPYAIVIFACLVPHLVQNFQIDTDRWRHLFMIYGLTWGVAAISRRWMAEHRAYAHQAYRAQAALGASMQPAE
jgi:O-antigen ligase